MGELIIALFLITYGSAILPLAMVSIIHKKWIGFFCVVPIINFIIVCFIVYKCRNNKYEQRKRTFI